jgi:hypothetical protein
MVAPPGFSGLVQFTGDYVAGFVACGICALIGVALLAPLRRTAGAGLRNSHGER